MTIHDQLAVRSSLPPGFRFHPTDEELILHYLRRRAAAAPCPAPVIAEVDIYKLDPWELPARAANHGNSNSNEWYFFSPRERKYPNGVRPNRAAGSGYWKATGTDKPIRSTATGGGGEMIGVKKALVFYQGRPPKGMKTNWIMHEYRLATAAAAGNTSSYSYRAPTFKHDASMRLDDWVLCRIYKKPDQQLMYEQSSSSMEYDGAITHYQHQYQQPDVYHGGEPSRPTTMPRPPSISDYLVDYSAVSELLDSMPPPEARMSTGADQFFLDLTAGAATGDEDDASTPTRKRQQQSTSVDETSSRWLSDASTTTMPMMNTTSFSMSPAGQSSHSHQDRI